MKALKKIACISAACMIFNSAAPVIASLPVSAAEESVQVLSGICGEKIETGSKVFWELDPATGTLTITGQGRMYDYLGEEDDPTGNLGWLHDMSNENYKRAKPAPWGKDIKKVVMGFGITSVGRYAFSGCKKLESVTLSESITDIEAFAFCNSGVKEIMFPKGIMCVNEAAFYGCEALETVNFDGAPTCIASYAFSCCTALKAISLPKLLTTIGDEAFSGCTALAKMHLPFTLEEIGANAFTDTPWLTEKFKTEPYFVFNRKLIAADPALQGAITLPEGLECIGTGAFANNQGITSVVIPDEISRIGERAFSNCTALESVQLPKKLSDISSGTFSGCIALKAVEFPDGLHSVGRDAFRNCSSLTEITLPDTCRRIYDGSFADCISLKKVTILDPDMIFDEDMVKQPVFLSNQDDKYTGVILSGGGSTVQNYAESIGCEFEAIQIPPEKQTLPANACGDHLEWKLDADGTLTISGTGKMYDYLNYERRGSHLFYVADTPWSDQVRKVVVEEGVTSIGSGAFYSFQSLQSVSLPESLTEIRPYAFKDCTLLTKIALPENLETIGEFAFSQSRLTALVLPAKLKRIENQAFESSMNLTEITIPAGTEYIGSEAFAFCEKLETVKFAAGDAYNLKYVGSCAFDFTPWFLSRMENADFVIENGILLKVNPALSGDVVIPDQVKIIAGHALDEVGYSEDDNAQQSDMTVTVPEGVITICDGAFCWCGAKTIKLPSTLTDIYDSAFFNCFSLENINLPEHLRTIGCSAFGNCERLKAIVIPESVEQIGIDAFENCEKLESVKILNPKTVIGDEPTTFTNPKQLFDHLTFTGVIYGYENSTAQDYADRYERQFVLMPAGVTTSLDLTGDVTCDGSIDVADAVMLARLVAEDDTAEVSASGIKNADVSRNGSPDSEDVIMILKFIAKIITSF